MKRKTAKERMMLNRKWLAAVKECVKETEIATPFSYFQNEYITLVDKNESVVVKLSEKPMARLKGMHSFIM